MKRNLLYLVMCLMAITFSHAQFTNVAIVGPAAAGWPGEGDIEPATSQLTSTDGENWSGDITMTAGQFKFRANHSWSNTTTWGTPTVGAGWPSGTAVQPGADIACTTAGTYNVTFNSTTGVYNFGGAAPIAVVKLVGTSSPGGDLTMTTADGETYILTNITLTNGNAQFDIDGSIFGGDTFPNGFISDPTLFIPVAAGTYSSVSVNIGTGEYSFTLAPVYDVISITGIAVGGWGDGFDFDMTTTDGVIYTYSGLAVNGVAPDNLLKFRTNHDWNQPNYGGTGWPSGIATTTGDNIAATATGLYDVTFNLTTGEYAFYFPGISLVGSGAGGWPETPENPGPIDNNQLTTTDGVNYTLNGVVLTDGLAKFRQNNGWAVNWGAAVFPAGTGLQNGENIPTVAGTYDVLFNRSTGDYSFAVLATKGFSTSNFRVYPNPSQNDWNFTSAKEVIQTVQIVDILGKTIMTVSPQTTTAKVNISSLNAGVYFARIATASATQTIKLMKN